MSIPRILNNHFKIDYDQELLVEVTPKHIRTTEQVLQMDINKRECYLPDENFLKYFKFYTVSNCQLECLTNLTLKNCGCVLFYMPSRYLIYFL